MANRRHRVSTWRLDDYMRTVAGRPEVRHTLTQMYQAVPEVLAPAVDDSLSWMNKRKRGKKEEIFDITDQQAAQLLAAIHGPGLLISDADKVIASWTPQGERVVHLPLGSADRGEIEVIDRFSDVNLIPPPTDRWVHVYVDQVRFWMRWDDAGGPVAGTGTYVRIETPGRQDGAVVLPVDEKSGDVCLVSQYRHPMRCLLTEAPRGFADVGLDKDVIDTALRELAEETNLSDPRLQLLKHTYTDSGKLADKPALFLAFVDRARQVDRFTTRKPLMLDPVWVPLLDFYDAVFARSAVSVDPGRLSFVQIGPHQSVRRVHTDLAYGMLSIEDAFTIQAALLALPRLKKRFPELFAARVGPWT